MAIKLIFGEVSPIAAERHSGWHAREVQDFPFAKDDLVPLMATEFASAVSLESELICLHLASLRNFELLRYRSLECEPASVSSLRRRSRVLRLLVIVTAKYRNT